MPNAVSLPTAPFFNTGVVQTGISHTSVFVTAFSQFMVLLLLAHQPLSDWQRHFNVT